MSQQCALAAEKASGILRSIEESYTVMNYAMLDQVSVEKVETTEPPSPPPGRPGGHLLRVAMERDSEGRREEVMLSAETL